MSDGLFVSGNMTKADLRRECSRLFSSNTIKDSGDMLDIYSEFLFRNQVEKIRGCAH